MNKIYHLSSCNTCQRIIDELGRNRFELQDIKIDNIDSRTLDRIKKKIGSYEAIFSRRAMKYRSLGLNNMKLTEDDYRDWMLKEYTFLKRPFILIGEQVFVGNAKKVIEEAKLALDAQ